MIKRNRQNMHRIFNTCTFPSQLKKPNDGQGGERIIWRSHSRSAKDVNSIRKRLRRLVSSAHILTTPTPVSSIMSLATVLQNLACKKPHTTFFYGCWCADSMRPWSVEQLLHTCDLNMALKRSMYGKERKINPVAEEEPQTWKHSAM